MRVGVAYVDVRVNMAQYKTDLDSLVRNAQNATSKVNATMSKMGTGYSKIKTGATAASTGMDKVTTSAKKQSRSMLGLIPHVAMVTASYMAMRSAWRALVSGLGAGIEFEQKMAVVRAVSRATTEEFADLEVAARKMAAGTVFTATETADALKYLAMAGFNAKEAIAALPGVLNLALIGELELGRATDIATDTLKAFGLEAEELSRVNDVMVSTITRSNTNIEMMGQAMKFAAPVAKALGYEIEQVSAMIGTLAQSGVKAGIAGRNLQQAFVRTTKAARDMGLGVGSNLIDVLKAYNKEQERLEVLYGRVAARESIATKIRKDYGLIALKSILILKDSIVQYERLADAAYLSSGEAERAAWIMQDNVSSAFKILKSALAEISISIFDDYKGGLKDLLHDTTEWLKSNADAFKVWADAAISTMQAVIFIMKTFKTGWEEIHGLLPKWAQIGLTMVNPLKNIKFLSDIEKATEVLGEDRVTELAMQAENMSKITGEQFIIFRDLLRNALLVEGKISNEMERQVQLQDLLAKGAQGRLAAVTKVKEGYEDFYTGIISTGKALDDLVGKQIKLAVAELPTSAKTAFYDALKLEEFKEGIGDTFEAFKDLEAFAGSIEGADKYTAAAKAATNAMIAEYKSRITAYRSMLKQMDKDSEKLAAKSVELEQGKVEGSIRAVKLEMERRIVIAKEAGKYTSDIAAKIENQSKDEINMIYKEGRIKKLESGRRYDHEEMMLLTKHQGKTLKMEEQHQDAIIKFKKARGKNEPKDKAAEIAAQIKLYSILTDTLKVRDADYFKYKQALLDFEFDKYIELYEGDSGKIALLMKAYYQKQRENMREQLRASESFFDGIKAFADEASEDLLTMGDLGYEMGQQFSDNATSALSETLLDGFKTGFDNIEDIWTKMLESMLAAYLDFLSKMLVQQAMAGLAQAFSIGVGGYDMSGAGGSPMAKFPGLKYQKGGWIDEPVMGIGTRTGKSYSIGEVEPEYIMPKSKMKGVVQEKGGGGFGENAPPNVSIVVQNNTGVEAKSYTEQPRFDGEGWVIGVVMDAYDRNKSGMRDVMRRR